MAKAKSFGKFKINILDNGTAQYALTVVDAAGLTIIFFFAIDITLLSTQALPPSCRA